MVTCYVCGCEFEPTAEEMRAWAESGRNFDPTDWECPHCFEHSTNIIFAEPPSEWP